MHLCMTHYLNMFFVLVFSARKAMRIYPELPLVARCHNYEIHCKYTYKCTSCGYQ